MEWVLRGRMRAQSIDLTSCDGLIAEIAHARAMSQLTSNAHAANFGRLQKNMRVSPQLDDAPKQSNTYLNGATHK